MSVKITDTEMSSDITTHTAKLFPFKEQPPAWSVTWLPGRILTRSQVITAMTIAETVLEYAPLDEHWQLQVDQWAAELGITGPIAIADASKPRTVPPILDAGYNRDGEICPLFCTTDHDEELIPGHPEHGYMSTHRSDPVHHRELGGAMVSMVQPSGSGVPRVSLSGDYGRANLEFSATEARLLAAIILDPVNDIARLASELSVAADMLSTVSMRAAR
jgi:hypothetical protein